MPSPGSKYGNKLSPNDPSLPRELRAISADDLAGSPKGPRVGPIGDRAPRPPVRRRGKATQRATLTGRG